MEQTLHPLINDRTAAPSEDIAQLSAILRVVDELAGSRNDETAGPDLALLDARHAEAPGVVRARYARLAERTAAFSAAGVAALIGAAAERDASRRAAAGYLAGEMRHAIEGMTRLLSR